MQTPSSPLSLFSLFSTPPINSMQNSELEGVAAPVQGFSSMLQRLLSATSPVMPAPEAGQTLPNLVQTLPAQTEPVATLSPAPEQLTDDALPSLLAQLSFGALSHKPSQAPAAGQEDADENEESAATPLFSPIPVMPLPVASPQPLSVAETLTTPQNSPIPSPLGAALTAESGGDAQTLLPSNQPPDMESETPVELDALARLNTNAEPKKESGATVNSAQLTQSQLQSSQQTTPALVASVTGEAMPAAQLPPPASPTPALAATAASAVGNLPQPNPNEAARLAEKLEMGAGQHEFGAKLNSRILLMVADNIQQARIQLDPPELGSLEIKLHIQHEQTSVQVHAANPQVRDVLEASAQRLRDALASQGLELRQFDVSTGQGHQGQQSEGQETAQDNGDWLHEEETKVVNKPSQTVNLLDTFA